MEAADLCGNQGGDEISLDEIVSLHSGQETLLRNEEPTPARGGGFRFQTQLPMEERASHVNSRNQRGPTREIPAACQPTGIMDQDWAGEYLLSDQWSEIWTDLLDVEKDWPEGYTIRKGKLYAGEKLCIPEGLALEMVRNHHFWSGHPGVEKLVKGLPMHYEFPAQVRGETVRSMVERVKRGCVNCQVTEHPNWVKRGKYFMTPVPEAPFVSVCLYIFSMSSVVWQKTMYDCILVCVDRHSGWIIALPTQYIGFTAEKCAHMLLDGGWSTFGIPAVVTSNQGAHFVGQWFQTMCARLGIRHAYSQAYRPQANGRAEAAGKQLIVQLRKIHTETPVNWMEALPRALRCIHDRVGLSGVTPYRILMGRERPLGGIPYQSYRDCTDAQFHFNRIEEVDRHVAAVINAEHLKAQEAHNRRVKERPFFCVGDHVFLAKPDNLEGHKPDTHWTGPGVVVHKGGRDS